MAFIRECAAAIGQSINQREIVSFEDIVGRVQELGRWNRRTIAAQVLLCTANCHAAIEYWGGESKPILFQRWDGQYELYDRELDPNGWGDWFLENPDW